MFIAWQVDETMTQSGWTAGFFHAAVWAVKGEGQDFRDAFLAWCGV